MNRKSDRPVRKAANLDLLDVVGTTSESGSSQLIPLADLVPRSNQPRRYFDSQKLQSLACSIAEQGILEDLLVRPIEEDKYEIIFGERRYRAARLAGLSAVPCKVRQLSDEEALELSLVENLQREDINPVEETEGILQLLSAKLHRTIEEVVRLLHRMQNEAKGKVTQNVLGSSEVRLIEETFNSIGKISWQSFASARLPLLKLPEDILEVLRQGRLEYTKAKAIAKVKDDEARIELLEEAIAGELSLSQIEERVGVPIAPREPTPAAKLKSLYTRLKKEEKTLKQKSPQRWQKIQRKARSIEKAIAELEGLISEAEVE